MEVWYCLVWWDLGGLILMVAGEEWLSTWYQKSGVPVIPLTPIYGQLKRLDNPYDISQSIH
jgi:hypothetical protein